MEVTVVNETSDPRVLLWCNKLANAKNIFKCAIVQQKQHNSYIDASWLAPDDARLLIRLTASFLI